ncbi:LysM peptidoglycan-binding domain-containing protein [Desulfovibrio sp. OttesenSCG-928-F07]|nr:LysM peptidoglycan-binding domain-containing protein [Desulfovibrio sp. OttesenSCG-928-F07]
MNQINITRKFLPATTGLCALLLCAMLSGGCAFDQMNNQFRANYNAPDDAVEEAIDDTPDELVEIPELPQDDGIPLGFAERIAFHSTGYLDADLSAEDKRLVERHFKYYLHKQRQLFERYVERSENYLPYVRQVFLEKGIPEEVAFLAIVESGFNANAVSRAGATGMWQFMRFTGKRYGLEQNAWIDERRDPYKATVAAADYLNRLYEMFGDWHLAIASYNAGEGKISRALASSGAGDFFELCRLNNTIPQRKTRLKLETQQYVPRLLAVTKIMRNLEILGFRAPNDAVAYNVKPVKVMPGTDLGTLARQSGMGWAEFKKHNPAYRQTISPLNASSTAYVPESNHTQALAWLAKSESARFAGWQQYRVRRGDSLYAISNRCGVSVSVLRQANNLKSNMLREGAILIVPGSKNARTAVAQNVKAAPAAQSTQKITAGSTLYTVKKGDSLYSIAKAYGVTVNGIQRANNMGSGSTHLTVGQKLGIPAKSGTVSVQAQSAQASGSTLVVRKGDTLYGIALQNNTSVDELLRVNGLQRGKPIMPGQTLRLP